MSKQLATRHHLQFAELAETIKSCLHELDANEWEIGRCLSAARKLSYDKAECAAQGIEGDNPDARLKTWVCNNLLHTPLATNRQLRMRLQQSWEAFGGDPSRVASLPKSAVYKLAEPQNAGIRDDILDQFANKKPSVKEVSEAIAKARGQDAPKPKAKREPITIDQKPEQEKELSVGALTAALKDARINIRYDDSLPPKKTRVCVGHSFSSVDGYSRSVTIELTEADLRSYAKYLTKQVKELDARRKQHPGGTKTSNMSRAEIDAKYKD